MIKLLASLMFAAALWGAYPTAVLAQDAAGTTQDLAAPAGANYDKAEFRLWLPEGATRVRAILVLVPGSNGDGRPMTANPDWRAYARRHNLALIGCRFTDKTPSMIEDYVNVSQGSGQALVRAISDFAARSKHPELADAPFLMWGMSAGGQFNYEFNAWKPERVIAFVVNKGGFYYSGLVSRAARATPGLLFVGLDDMKFRTDAVTGVYAMNRRAGAPWALVREPGVAHAEGRSREMARLFFDEVLGLRLEDGKAALKPIAADAGFTGDLETKTISPVAGQKPPIQPTSWLPTEAVARAWAAVMDGVPFTN